MAECVQPRTSSSVFPQQCTPDEESENREQQTNEIEMLQSIFEGQFVLLNITEYMVQYVWLCVKKATYNSCIY